MDCAYAATAVAHLFPDADPERAAERLAAFGAGYDMDPSLRQSLPEVMVQPAQAMLDLLRTSHEGGVDPCGSIYVEGHGDHWAGTVAFVARHLPGWRVAVGNDRHVPVPSTRRVGGHAAAARFAGVFPGNVWMVWAWRHRPCPWQLVSLGRLPSWRLWCARRWGWRERAEPPVPGVGCLGGIAPRSRNRGGAHRSAVPAPRCRPVLPLAASTRRC